MPGAALLPGNRKTGSVTKICRYGFNHAKIYRGVEMKKWIILGMVFLVAGLLISGCAKAPEGTGVYGKVVDKETKKPVEGVTITITALRQVTEASPAVWAVTATTDNSGNYSLPGLEPGSYAVTVTSPGYFAYSFSELVVKEGKMKKIDIRLEASFIGG